MKIENGIFLLYSDEYGVKVSNSIHSPKTYLCLYTKDKNDKWVDTDLFFVYPRDYFDDFIVVLNNEVEKLIKKYENGEN